jgi:hypothetical protein
LILSLKIPFSHPYFTLANLAYRSKRPVKALREIPQEVRDEETGMLNLLSGITYLLQQSGQSVRIG